MTAYDNRQITASLIHDALDTFTHLLQKVAMALNQYSFFIQS